MSNYELVTVNQSFFAEKIGSTGSEELLQKAARSYIGLYDKDENWYLPLRSNLNEKKPEGNYFSTPFKTDNPHFINPGIDFEKAVFVDENYIIPIENTLPKEQSEYIFENQTAIREQFETYVLNLQNITHDKPEYQFSTIPLFPEGIDKIREARLKQEKIQISAEEKSEISELIQSESINISKQLKQMLDDTLSQSNLENAAKAGTIDLETVTNIVNQHFQSIETLIQKQLSDINQTTVVLTPIEALKKFYMNLAEQVNTFKDNLKQSIISTKNNVVYVTQDKIDDFRLMIKNNINSKILAVNDQLKNFNALVEQKFSIEEKVVKPHSNDIIGKKEDMVNYTLDGATISMPSSTEAQQGLVIPEETEDLLEETEEDSLKPDIIEAENLPTGWVWHQFEDGSGSLQSPEGQSYFSYDLATREVKHPNTNQWILMSKGQTLEDLKITSEKWVQEHQINKSQKLDSEDSKDLQINVRRQQAFEDFLQKDSEQPETSIFEEMLVKTDEDYHQEIAQKYNFSNPEEIKQAEIEIAQKIKEVNVVIAEKLANEPNIDDINEKRYEEAIQFQEDIGIAEATAPLNVNRQQAFEAFIQRDVEKAETSIFEEMLAKTDEDYHQEIAQKYNFSNPEEIKQAEIEIAQKIKEVDVVIAEKLANEPDIDDINEKRYEEAIQFQEDIGIAEATAQLKQNQLNIMKFKNKQTKATNLNLSEVGFSIENKMQADAQDEGFIIDSIEQTQLPIYLFPDGKALDGLTTWAREEINSGHSTGRDIDHFVLSSYVPESLNVDNTTTRLPSLENLGLIQLVPETKVAILPSAHLTAVQLEALKTYQPSKIIQSWNDQEVSLKDLTKIVNHKSDIEKMIKTKKISDIIKAVFTSRAEGKLGKKWAEFINDTKQYDLNEAFRNFVEDVWQTIRNDDSNLSADQISELETNYYDYFYKGGQAAYLEAKANQTEIEYSEQSMNAFQKSYFETINKELVADESKVVNTEISSVIKKKDTVALSKLLKEGIVDYLQTDTFKKYLDYVSQFRNYSSKNIQLILSQNPQAQQVASLKKWHEFERTVKKGSKAIYIYAPSTYTVKDENGQPKLDENNLPIKATNFRLVPVFDVSQTAGAKELPKPIYQLKDNFKDPNEFIKAFNALSEISPVPIEVTQIDSKANGYYHPEKKLICIQERMGEEMTIKTLIHEITHAQLHANSNVRYGDQRYSQNEFEAESVAYIVCNHLGIDSSSYSFGYLSSWTNQGSDLEKFEASLNKITLQAQDVINQLEHKLTKELTITTPKNKFEERLQQTQELSPVDQSQSISIDPKVDSPSPSL